MGLIAGLLVVRFGLAWLFATAGLPVGWIYATIVADYAVKNLLLAARARGYGGALTMWHLGVEAELRELLGVPDGVALSACITLGVPEGNHGPLKRKPLNEIVFDDAWGRPPDWIER